MAREDGKESKVVFIAYNNMVLQFQQLKNLYIEVYADIAEAGIDIFSQLLCIRRSQPSPPRYAWF